MKKSTKQIWFIIVLIAFLSTAFLSVVYGQDRENSLIMDSKGVTLTNYITDYDIIYYVGIMKSKKKFTRMFQIVSGKRNYYTNALILQGDDNLRFIELYRNGELKEHCFRFGTFKIYQSK